MIKINKALLLVITASLLSACNPEHHTIKVKNTERITRSGGGGYYLIFTDGGVFKNGDSLVAWKFNSSDMQNNIEAGECYLVKTRFWRIPFLSMYKNITKLTQVDC